MSMNSRLASSANLELMTIKASQSRTEQDKDEMKLMGKDFAL